MADEDANEKAWHETWERWADEPPVTLGIPRRDAWMLLGGLQFLARSPELPMDLAVLYERYGRQIQEVLCDSPELYIRAEANWVARS